MMYAWRSLRSVTRQPDRSRIFIIRHVVVAILLGQKMKAAA